MKTTTTTPVQRYSHDFIKCVSSLLYGKIRLNQLQGEMKTERYHTTASRDALWPDDLVRPCANAELLQDAFSVDAPCTEVIVGQWHLLSYHSLLMLLHCLNATLHRNSEAKCLIIVDKYLLQVCTTKCKSVQSSIPNIVHCHTFTLCTI